jgi:hypothetical protein
MRRETQMEWQPRPDVYVRVGGKVYYCGENERFEDVCYVQDVTTFTDSDEGGFVGDSESRYEISQREIAGTPVKCFIETRVKPERWESCFTADGILVHSSTTFEFGSGYESGTRTPMLWTFSETAEHIDRHQLAGSLFSPPYVVVERPQRLLPVDSAEFPFEVEPLNED